MAKAYLYGGEKKAYTTCYNKFKGVDFSTDPAKIDASRSPDALNLMPDKGGFPQKRPGWRTLYSLEDRINGVFSLKVDSKDVFLIHAGTKLYKKAEDSELTLIKEGVKDSFSVSFCLLKKLYILTGGEYLCFDGESVTDVTESAYVPTTTIARAPSGGGEFFESINLLSPYRKNCFIADGETKAYYLDSNEIDQEAVTVTVNDIELIKDTDFTVDYTLGRIDFVTAPPAPAQTGQDNVTVIFKKTVEGYKERILNCTVCDTFGVGGSNRVFVSGNDNYKSSDWHSEINDPAYFPDDGYSLIGNDNTSISGYLKMGEYHGIVKEDNAAETTLFLRSGSLDSINNKITAVFPLKQGISGVGAIAKRTVGGLLDEPLFLSRTGVYGVSSNSITLEKTVKNRSFFIDTRLLEEENLKDAVAVSYNGLYIIAINSHCYILDGRQEKAYKPLSNGDYVYECLYWDNIPAVCFLEKDGELYFGTDDGRVCRFNTDLTSAAKYNDDGKAIVARWSTKADDDGDFMLKKTMLKKGSGLMLKPYSRSSCKVYIRTDKDFGKLIKSSQMDIFSFEDLNFDRLSFNTNDSPQVVPFLKKVKKYITAQIIVTNDEINEGFGVLGIVKRYSAGNYVK